MDYLAHVALYQGEVHNTLTSGRSVKEVLYCFLYKHNVHSRLVAAGGYSFTEAQIVVVKQSEECSWNLAPAVEEQTDFIRGKPHLIFCSLRSHM